MNRSRKRLLFLALLLLLIGVPSWLIYREVRQQQLDHALIAAIKENDTATVISLLAQGADANARDMGEQNVSVWQQVRRMFHRMRGKKASQEQGEHPSVLVLALNRPGAPTYPAIQSILLNQTAIVKTLLDKGAQVNDVDAEGTSPLMLACWSENTDTILLLLDHKADVQTKNRRGDTALHWACRFEDKPIVVQRLLAHGAQIEARSLDGMTPLMEAADNDNEAMLRTLLRHKAHINVRDNNGKTALFHAVEGNEYHAVRVLLRYGADVTPRSKMGYSVLDVALLMNVKTIDKQTIPLLKQAGAKK